MKRLCLILVFLLSLGYLAGCSDNAAGYTPDPAETTVPSSLPVSSDPPEMSGQERYWADYHYLWDLLENEYPGYHAAVTLTRKDFSVVRETYGERIANVTDDYAFSNVVRRCLREFQSAGHLGMIPISEYDKMWDDLQRQMEDGSLQPMNRTNFDCMKRPRAQHFYGRSSQYETPANASSSSNALGTNLSISLFPDNLMAYLSVKEMTKPYERSDGRELADFFRQIEAAGYKHCVIDIRGTSSGSDSYWLNAIVEPNLKGEIGWETYSLVKGEACAKYIQYAFDEPLYQISPISAFPLEQFPAMNKSVLEEFQFFYKKDRGLAREDGRYAPLFSGQFWILIDSGVYSTLETFAQFCRQTGFATLVGRPTSGGGGGIDPKVFSLPYTGICIKFDAESVLNPDGGFNGVVGTAPDILSPEGEDALNTCLNAIQKGRAS